MEDEDDSLVQATGHHGALQQEGLGIPFQGQVHGRLSEEQAQATASDPHLRLSPTSGWAGSLTMRRDHPPVPIDTQHPKLSSGQRT